VGDVGGQASALNIAASNMMNAALGNAIQSAASKAVAGLDAAAGVQSDDAGSSSLGNTGGPAGDVPGVDQTDRTKGPGHSTYKVSGSHKEKVGSLKVLATLNGINTNIGGNVTQNVGAAIIQMAYKDVAEAVTGSKKEKELGLIVSTKQGEKEHVGGSKTAMIGGAVLDKVGKNMSLEATSNLTMVGALQKLEAEEKITLKCGEACEMVISGDGIALKAPGAVSILAPKIQLTKIASEGG
jgi:type VI secretion system secreted protein VgrG